MQHQAENPEAAPGSNAPVQGEEAAPSAEPQAAAEQPPPPEREAEAPKEPEEVVRLRAQLEAAYRRVDELARAVQAMDRDKEEFKARVNRERERLLDVEKGNVALTLLEAIDDLDLSLSASADDQSPLAQGVRLIRENMLKRLEATGVQRLSVQGQPYNPALAEAVDMDMTTDPDQDGHVVAELRAGYRLKDRVIRPARVKVARYVKPADA